MTAAIRPSRGAAHSRIVGVGGYRPRRVVSNAELLNYIDSSDEWIRSRSGIGSRHWAAPDETVAEMSVAAAGKAIAHAGVTPAQLGCVIISTVSHMKQTPAIATTVAHRLGAHGAAAFDISAACAGFGYALNLADGMVRNGGSEHVLIIGVERLSDLTDIEDRSTAFLFGDGAGAAVVGPSTEPTMGPVIWGANGEHADVITQTHAWDELRPIYHGEATADDTPEPRWPAIRMEGQTVFRWAVWEMAKVAQQALDDAGVDVADLDVFVPHQANMRITDAMIKALNLPEHVPVARDIAETGNTSAASIPLAIERMLATGEASSGDTALVIGFGAGLVYAATVVTLP